MVEQGKEELLRVFPAKLRPLLFRAQLRLEELEEIRIRVGQPILFRYHNEECVLVEEEPYVRNTREEGIALSYKEMKEMLNYMCSYSVYAYAKEIQQGFLTLNNGHRVGICGEYTKLNGKDRVLEYPSFFNIRISHEKKNCAKSIMPYIKKEKDIYHTLIIASPGVGKTTLLRDVIRLLSKEEWRQNIALVDERYEVAACMKGVPQKEVGRYCDVIAGCEKKAAMMMLLRSMGPTIIAVDELGGLEEEECLRQVMDSGVRVIATVHARDLEELKKQEKRKWIFEEMFQRFVCIDRGNLGERRLEVYDEHGNILC